jgi:hypothetical protein
MQALPIVDTGYASSTRKFSDSPAKLEFTVELIVNCMQRCAAAAAAAAATHLMIFGIFVLPLTNIKLLSPKKQ